MNKNTVEVLEFNNIKNGSMEFNINTLKPTYRLNIGKAGDSNASLIALRLGMEKRIIERTQEITYKERKEYSYYDTESIEDKIVDKVAIENHEDSIKKLEDSKYVM